MRHFFLFVFIIQIYVIPSFSSNPINKSLKIGVISDLHYLSNSLMDNGSAINDYVKNTGKDVIQVPQILDEVIDIYLNSDIAVLLITGDLTKDGEKQSHIDLTHKLQLLIDKGIQIFVIPGNHDINVPKPQGYKGDQTYITENLSPSDFNQIYHDFGYGKAIYKDSTSLSYIAELNNNTWLLALDGCLYKEYIDQTISAGKISKTTRDWIEYILKLAKTNNKQIIGMMHHGLIEHFPMQSTFFKDYLIENNQELATLFADNNIKIFFTGHFHANDITEFTSPAGNKIYDVETGSLCSYPFALRFVEINEDNVKITTQNITKTKYNPNLVNDNIDILKKIARARATNEIDNLGINISPDIRSEFIELVSTIFLKHLAGDEHLDKPLLESIQNITSYFDNSNTEFLEDIQLDFYPNDNNIELKLK